MTTTWDAVGFERDRRGYGDERQAIALAADSAITVTTRHGRKAWQSATKIVPLPPPHAVGLMLYGGTSLHRLPWDTILKEFRRTLPGAQYARLEDYTTALLRFLRGRRQLYPDDEQELYVYTKIVLEFLEVRRVLLSNVEAALQSSASSSLPPSEQKALIDEAIDFWHRSLTDAKRLNRLPNEYRKRLYAKYGRAFRKAKSDVFQQLPLTSGQSRKLTTVAQLFFERDWPIDSHTGLVVAGYGEADLFPRFERLRIDGFALNYLIAARDPVNAVTRDDSGGVWAFAQGDDVYAFMEGVLPAYQDRFESALHSKIVDLPLELLERVTVTPRQKSKMRRDVTDFCHEVFRETMRELEAYRRRAFVQPVLDVVSALPIEDLAVMAETLVNLTSFRQKVSMSVETVGGPVDVAVISKGDGFLWIKRKSIYEVDAARSELTGYAP